MFFVSELAKLFPTEPPSSGLRGPLDPQVPLVMMEGKDHQVSLVMMGSRDQRVPLVKIQKQNWLVPPTSIGAERPV